MNLRYLDPNSDDFVKHVKKECKEYNIKIYFGKGKKLKIGNGLYSTGFFDGETLAVATNRPFNKWFSVLIHEFGHFIQWKEDRDVWHCSIKSIPDQDAGELLDLWLTHKIELTESILKEVFESVINVERDCEQIALKLIKKFSLPINTDEYIRSANAYLYYHHIAKHKRKWICDPEGKFFYKPSILEAMPKNLNVNHNIISPGLYNYIEKEIYGESAMSLLG